LCWRPSRTPCRSKVKCSLCYRKSLIKKQIYLTSLKSKDNRGSDLLKFKSPIFCHYNFIYSRKQAFL
jgi:hypothetical protein